jgi:hypothetical protein
MKNGGTIKVINTSDRAPYLLDIERVRWLTSSRDHQQGG